MTSTEWELGELDELVGWFGDPFLIDQELYKYFLAVRRKIWSVDHQLPEYILREDLGTFPITI